MPSATQQAVPASDDTAASGGSLFPKKRSHEEYVAAGPAHNSRDDVVAIFANSGGNNGSTGSSHISAAAISSRQIIPLTKRARVDEGRCRTSPMWLSPQAVHERVPLSAPAKTNNTTTTATMASTTSTTKTPPSTSLTAPCHVCQRRPRRKCDLDSFSDCEGCGERTCFVCLRECLGLGRRQQQRQQLPDSADGQDAYDGCDYDTPSDGSMTPNEEERRTGRDSQPWLPDAKHSQATSVAADDGIPRGHGDANQQPQQLPWGSTPQTRGHRRMVCSQCCVERGADGEVVCLGCLAHAGSG